MPEPIPIRRTICSVDNTAEAAALMTVGVPFADTTDPGTGKKLLPIVTTKSAEHPRGITNFVLGGEGPGGVKAADLRATWKERRADVDFDALLDQLEAEVAKSPAAAKLVRRLRAQFPHALVAYFRGFSDNRARLLDLRNQGTQLLYFRRGETGHVLISENASNDTRRHCGLPTR